MSEEGTIRILEKLPTLIALFGTMTSATQVAQQIATITAPKKPEVKIAGRTEEVSREKSRPLDILVLVTNTPFYSGGRYHIYEICVALALIGHNVYISTNMVPEVIVRDFPKLPNIKFIEKAPNFIPEGYFDIVFGAPADLMWTGVSYARSKHIPSIVMILETPKWLSEYIPFYPDHKEEYWEQWGQKKALKTADYIFTNSETCKEKLLEWLPELKGKSHKKFSIIVLNNNSGYAPEEIDLFDYELLASDFEKPIEIRKMDVTKYSVFGFVFAETSPENEGELNNILVSDLRKYIRLL